MVIDAASFAEVLRLIDATSNAGGFGGGDWASNERLSPTTAEKITLVANVRLMGTSQPSMLPPGMIRNGKRALAPDSGLVITRHFATYGY
jgi:hypothetical protein